MSSNTLTRDSFDPFCLQILNAAAGRAELTDHARIEPGHLFLALVSEDGGFIDRLISERFGGLRAETIAASVSEIMEIAAPGIQGEDAAEGLLDYPCSSETVAVLRDSVARAASLNRPQATNATLTMALLSTPGQHILDAFGDARIGVAQLAALAQQAGPAPAARVEQPVFEGEMVRMAAFGPTAKEMIRTLTQLGETLCVEHLLIAALSVEDSRSVDALHVMGLHPESIRKALEKTHGSPEGPRRSTLESKRLNRMLKGMIQSSAKLALEEGRDVIGESQLIRSFVARVADSQTNALTRLQINPARLRSYLESYKEDRTSQEQGAQVIQDLEGFLSERVMGQERAIRTVLPALKRLRAGLNEPGRLMGIFLFLGATGVGKTELARAIADVAFGTDPGVKDSHLILINAGVLKEPRDIVQVLGAPQGLVGYKEGSLTNGLRDKGNRCVILFDEIEKAHPQVWQSLLQLFDEGLVIEADGTRYDATGSVLVGTSNLGYAEAIDQLRLFDRPADQLAELQPKLESFVWSRVVEYFSPELRGRFGRENVIFFNHFTQDTYRSMLERQTQALIAEMAGRHIAVLVEPEVIAALTDLAWENRAEGARPVRRLITSHIRHHIVIARSEDPDCTEVVVDMSPELERDRQRALSARRQTTVTELEPHLNQRVVGQEHAVAAVVPAVKRMRSGLNEPGRLMGSFMFLGPSGVGKTELAKAIAEVAFGAKPGVLDAHLIRIDCGKLGERRDIVQLLGAPQGLVGYKEGALTNALRDKGGRCVILFDEAEKACREIWQSLLTFFDEGIVTEADGTRYDATGCVLIATSNLGYADALQAFDLFNQPYEYMLEKRPQLESLIWDRVSKYFSPEFLGRFGRENVILFNHFSREHYAAIIKQHVEAFIVEMEGRGLTVQVPNKVRESLTGRAWEKRSEGARNVRRLLTLHLRNVVVDGVPEGRTVFNFFLRENGEIDALDR